MSGFEGKLTSRQVKAISLLLEQPTVAEVAHFVGVHERTVYRWLNNPGFVVQLKAEEGKLLENAVRRLVILADKAIDAIEDVMENPAQRGANVKRLASVNVLDTLLKLREMVDVEERLRNLEAKL